MSVREPPDWAGFRQAVAARQRLIMEGLAEFLRLDTVSQKPDRVRTGAEWLRQVMRARGLCGRGIVRAARDGLGV